MAVGPILAAEGNSKGSREVVQDARDRLARMDPDDPRRANVANQIESVVAGSEPSWLRMLARSRRPSP